MLLSGAEAFLFLTLIFIGLAGNLKLYLNQTAKERQFKWSISIYGAAIIVLICSVITPPDILSTIIVSAPVTTIYLITLRKIGYRKTTA